MTKQRNLYINSSSSITETLKRMDVEGTKLLIVGNESCFKGLISVGDLQRAIIKNYDLNSPIENFLRDDIIVANESEDIVDVKKKMLKIRSEFMPVINNNNHVVKILFWDDLLESQKLPPVETVTLPVVIMAGGKGTRLKPITNVLPKPLIPIGKKPIIEHIIDRFTEVGCAEFYFSVNFKSELIEYYFNSFEHPNYTIKYLKEKEFLGTAGSLNLLNGKINSTFFVSNCDIIIDQDYSEIYNYHKNNKNELTLVAALKHYNIPYGTVETGFNGELQKMVEKPEITYKINAGLYILEPHLLDEIPANKFFHITDLIDKIKSRQGRVGVFPVSEKSWKDIGEWDEYLKNMEE